MRYQDFVIKDGKLVGNFDEMYKVCEDPWEQSTRENYAYEKTIGLEIIKNNRYNNVLELGCGHGHYTNRVKSLVENSIGVDISDTAIEKARINYPDCKFITSDILNKEIYKNIDCILMVEITWYVLEKLKKFKEILSDKSGLGFFHTLNTYPPNVQSYGKEYFTNNEEIMNFFSDVIEIEEYGSLHKKKNDGCVRNYFYGKIK